MATVALNRLIAGSLFLGLSALVGSNACYVVPAGHRAILWDRGRGLLLDSKHVYGEGLRFLIPFWQRPVLYNVRITPKTIETETGTKDLQRVKLALRVLYRPKENELPLLHTSLGQDYAIRILPSIGNEVLKSVVARYDAVELITQRNMVSKEIRKHLTTRAQDFHIVLDDVAITDLSFGKEFSSAIEKKQVAQQQTEKAKYVVEKAEQERLAQVIRAEGEAEAARMITEATNEVGNSFVELRRIEAAKEIAATLAASGKITYIPLSNTGSQPGTNFLINLPQNK